MDKLTDFLTVFFVNNSVKEKDTKRVKKNKNDNIKESEIIPTQTISSNQNISNNIPLKIGKKTETETETPIKKASIKKASIKKASIKKASIQQENDNTFTSSENDNTFTSSENDNTELFTKSNSNSFSKSKENTDNLDKRKNLLSSLSFSSYNNKDKEIDKKEINKKEIDKKEIDKKEIDKKEIDKKEIDKEEINKEEIDKKEIDNALLKKYILKPSEFYKKNILIANDDKKNNFDITNDILYKLSLLKDIDNIYSKDIYIFTSNDNRKMFKQMLLDNPYLYFIDFHVKQNIDKNILKENNKEDNKRIICIIDTDILKNIDDLQDFINPQIHLILLTLETNKIMDYYNKIGNKRLLIHKQNKLKSLQKRFFKYVISNIDKKMHFDDYYNRINDENMDLKYIILKEDELRYN